MKHNLILFILLTALQTITISGYAVTSQTEIIKSTTISTTKKPIKERFFQWQISKKLKKWISKWGNQSEQTDKDENNVGIWTFISLGLITASYIFPPLIFIALITSIIALVKNKKKYNLRALDKGLAVVTLIISTIGFLFISSIAILFSTNILLGPYFW